jgi:hypothetical protein
VELDARWEVDAELEALRNSDAQVWYLVLDWADKPSSLAASLSMVAELLEGHIDIAVANGARWGARSVLVAALSLFPELETKMGLLGPMHDVGLT